jgi:uridylate kinase
MITSSPEVVSSFSKRDDSHIKVVDYPSITLTDRQTVQIYYINDSEDSNCDQVLEGGLAGTIMRMPDNCGLSQYIVTHSLKESAS